MQSMLKTKASYLLFDNEQTPYQERKDHEPSVKKFPSTEGLLTDEVPRKEKKRMALNRSLDGLIAKETNDLNENNYFK